MNGTEQGIMYGLAAAASWGTGDFSGGFAAKRNSAILVVTVSQLVGVLLLGTFALILDTKTPNTSEWIFGGLAGLAGAAGLVALYTGLARSPMGIVAPVAAVITTIIPLAASLMTEGLPKILQGIGFVAALGGVWLLSASGSSGNLKWKDLSLPVAAGIGFGLFFIFIDQATGDTILWPLVAARIASVIPLAAMTTFRQKWANPGKVGAVPILLSSIFDTLGNVFFALAAQSGRLDIASVITSLYPATTVLLAWLILKERLSAAQKIGIVLVLSALGMLAI